MKSYVVRFWAIRPGKAKQRRTYEVRWKVGHSPHSRTLGNKAQAENFLSDLRQAAKRGEAFDTETGLPDSMMTATQAHSWYTLCLAYVDTKWPHAAPKTRDATTDALATVIPAVASEKRPDWLDAMVLRRALRHYALPPGSRGDDRRPEIAAALRWMEKLPFQSPRSASPVTSGQYSMPSPSRWTVARLALPRLRESGRCSPAC